MKNCILFVYLALIMSGTVTAQFGALDPTFNATGNGANSDVYALTVQPDGKIFVGGIFTYYQAQPKKYLARLNQDGSLDNTFTTEFDNGIRRIIILPDGKILVAGGFANCITPSGTVAVRGIARLNADGSFDNTFNPGGFGIAHPLSPTPLVVSMDVTDDGKIVIAGDFITYNGITVNHITRLNADGTPDNTFNAGGTGADSPLDAVAIQEDGQVVIGGTFTSFNGTTVGRLARLTINGTLDTTFNPGGTGLNGNGYITAYELKIQPDEKIVVGGAFTSYNGILLNNLIRLNTNGSIDNTFNPGGSAASDPVLDLLLLADNRIVFSGLVNSYNGTTIGRIGCLNTDGTLDNTFNTGGTASNDLVFAIAETTDNKLVIGGIFTSYNGTAINRVARLNPDACTPTNGTDIQTACGSFTWIDETIYTSSNTTATHTIVGGAANGCDSIVTLNLTINQPTTGTDTQTACESYTWINGTIYTSSNTTATHTIIGGAANGCDSVVTLNLTIPTINTNVTTSGVTIEAELTGVTYQWIDCTSDAPISGATARTYAATENGSYAVIITQNNCSDTSNCIQIATIGLEELTGWSTALYPNPSNGHFTIDWGIETENMLIEITDVTGKTVYRSTVSGSRSHAVEMQQTSGMYYAKLSNSTQSQVIKVILD